MSKRHYKQGINRDQGYLLPPSMEEYVQEDNPVRAIDSYVESLEIEKLKFENAEGEVVDTNGQEREIDMEYYVKHQILPPVGRILNYFDYDDSELEGQPFQSTLGHF